MGKIWKIPNNKDIRLALEYLKIEKSYINILLEEDSDFDKYLKEGNDYVLIIFDGTFGWVEYEYFSEYKNKHKYCGIVDFRKNKLKKLNAKFRQNT